MPPSLIRALPSYPPASSSAYLPPGTDPNENVTIANSGMCGGQTISASSTKRDGLHLEQRNGRLDALDEDYSGYARVKRASSGSCDLLSQT